MSHRGPSSALKRAIERVRGGETAYAAARAEEIALSTIYRSELYKSLAGHATRTGHSRSTRRS